MGLSREELFARIRQDYEREQLPVRELARRYQVGRPTVREALTGSSPRPRKIPERLAPSLGEYHATIDRWLREDLDAPPKQRHTVKRITERLIDEYGANVKYGTVRDYVTPRRAQIEAETAPVPESVSGFVPRHHHPGRDAEVDFGEVWVLIGGTLVHCHMFVLRLCYSGKAVHRVYASCGQEAFLDGHVHAFRVLGGVPAGVVRYDNLTPAVVKVLFKTRDRVENPRWSAFHQSLGFNPWYCQPGITGAHEKGGVEGEVGYFRRNYLSPVPAVASLEELNTRIVGFEKAEEARRIGLRRHTIGEDFAAEAPLLRPLPGEEFDTRLLLTPTVDRYAMITVRTCRYSVPARLIGKRVRVLLGASDLIVYDRNTIVARHPRLIAKGAERVELDHYLEILMRKPGALAGSAALEQAKNTGVFTAAHQALWDAANTAMGDKQAGTKVLVEILLLHRYLDRQDVTAGIRAALAVGQVAPDIVALEARKHAQAHGRSPTVTGTRIRTEPAAQRQPDTSHGQAHRIAALPTDKRPAPNLSIYDQLLQRPGQEP